MERILQKINVSFVVVMVISPLIMGVKLVAPPEKKAPTAQTYPESKFGQPPADPTTGKPRRVNMESEIFPLSRNPAGLMIRNDDPGYRPKPKKVLEDVIPDRKKGVQEVALIAGDLGYFPRTFFVTRNVPVRIFLTGASKNTLCMMMDSFNIRKQVRSQKIEEISFVPRVTGKYRFYCPVNGMEGTMIVKSDLPI